MAMQNRGITIGNHEPELAELLEDPITLLAMKSSGAPVDQVRTLFINARTQVQRTRKSVAEAN